MPDSTPELRVACHRLGAGEPDEGGWCAATSTEGGFSVRLPTLFNDFTMTGRSTDGVQIKMCGIGMRTEGGVAYSANATTRGDGKLKGNFLAEFGKGFGSDVVSRESVVHRGLTGVQLRVADRRATSLMRAFETPGRLYMLIVEYERSPAMPPAVEADARLFLDSFQIGGPN